jgi:hypothetical protein
VGHTDKVVDRVVIGKGLVAALVGQHPHTGHHRALSVPDAENRDTHFSHEQETLRIDREIRSNDGEFDFKSKEGNHAAHQ